LRRDFGDPKIEDWRQLIFREIWSVSLRFRRWCLNLGQL
jgi:hypothetical protein